MKRLKKGFTLIELLVVIAIIGILATTLAPKLREQLAKAKDAKAVALLGAARTAASTLVVDKMVQATTAGSISKITATELMARLDKKSNEIYNDTDSSVLVGGTRKSPTDSVNYDGGGVSLATSGSAIKDGISISDDEVSIELLGGTDKTYSTEGKLWTKY